MIRNQIFKVQLVFDDASILPITIGCKAAESIPILIEKNKMLYQTMKKSDISHFTVTDYLPTIGMDDEKYDGEILFCDIVES